MDLVRLFQFQFYKQLYNFTIWKFEKINSSEQHSDKGALGLAISYSTISIFKIYLQTTALAKEGLTKNI